MKTNSDMRHGPTRLIPLAAAAALLSLAPGIATAQEKKSDAAPVLANPPPGTPPEIPELVRVTLLMVSMPQEKFLALMPDLLDKEKLEKTIPGLFDAIKRKEMTLGGLPQGRHPKRPARGDGNRA